MYVIITTDGSKQSLQAARYLKSVADPDTITSIAVLAVISPLAAVPFATADKGRQDPADMSFRESATAATKEVAAILAGWGPKVTTQIRSGSPASEIVKAAKAKDAGLIVLAARSSRAEAVLMGSVAHRVLNHAPCPVLVVPPGTKIKAKSKAKPAAAAKKPVAKSPS
ncbi:universal stress protein [Aeromicrobium wangtongii]|uniref:Universal stress protein n=1 Tax=Aeromicrobium wangtongii TaxID=2969247 RepID=A0ABY5M5C2_9ACTN|nr:universal stress protein [Aeromicrobium wangtongii]MCD9200115.1 universal stress protein [Aeromicrobium wangtongii]UUP13370.1 universal stress protein [Aeromicrobium wangtongii]